MTEPTLGRLTRVFLRIGNTTFGGGSVTIVALQRELIERKGWITQEDYGLAYAMARITPGTVVLAFCAAIAAKIRGVPGAIAAVVAVTLPSALLAILLTQGYETWRTNPVAMAAMAGAFAAVAGMMWAAVWLLLKPHFGPGWRALRIAIFAGGAFLAAWRFGVTPVPIIAISAVIGFFWKDRDLA